jgi:hypothetical protein
LPYTNAFNRKETCLGRVPASDPRRVDRELQSRSGVMERLVRRRVRNSSGIKITDNTHS